MKKIDIHTHGTYFPDIVPRRSDGTQFLSGEELIDMADKLDVEFNVLLPLISPEAQCIQMSNEATYSIVKKYPDRFIWFCNVDPRAGTYSADYDLSYLINYYKGLGAKGLGELTTPLPADDPMMDNLFSHCVACDMPVLIHIAPQKGGTYGIVDELGLPRIERMLKKHPDLKLIGHSAAFWSEISDGLVQSERDGYPTGKVKEGRLPKLMRTYGNLYCDLSAGSGSNAMTRDPEYAAKFIEEFSDRILYGSDICSINQTYQFDFLDFLQKMLSDHMISTENYEKIIRKNAIKLLRLDNLN